MIDIPKIKTPEDIPATPEENQDAVEVKQEKAPLTPEEQQEEIKSVFESILQGKEYKTLKEKFDDRGLAVWEIEVKTDEGTAEYSYVKKGEPVEGQICDTKIDVYFIDEDGMPTGGDTVAILEVEGWKLLEPTEPKNVAEQALEDAYAEGGEEENVEKEVELIEGEGKIECTPHIEELEEMLTPFLDQELLDTLTSIETEQQAKESEQREEAKVALSTILKKMQFLKKETNITEEDYAELHAKKQKISRAVGMISGKKGHGIVDHER